MKQHITKEQLEELTGEQRGKLELFWKNNYKIIPHDYPTPNIGQMIEFLDKKKQNWFWCAFDLEYDGDTNEAVRDASEELADALWEAVKEVL